MEFGASFTQLGEISIKAQFETCRIQFDFLTLYIIIHDIESWLVGLFELHVEDK